jgi:16S rRNA (guanine527-N7)-methyltransferase
MNEENEMGHARIVALLAPFGIEPSEAQITQIQTYIRLLLHWNLSLNLTSVGDPEGIVERHFGESMFLTKMLAVENCRLADIGSGAGFPGLAIKLICPTIRLTLIESNQKMCAFIA